MSTLPGLLVMSAPDDSGSVVASTLENAGPECFVRVGAPGSRLALFNQGLVSILGGTLGRPPLMPAIAVAEKLRGYRHDAEMQWEEALTQRCDERPDPRYWIWDDPLNVILLPFWDQILPPFDPILAFRSPAEAIRRITGSVVETRPEALALWNSMVRMGLVGFRGQMPLLIEVIGDGIAQPSAARLADHLDELSHVAGALRSNSTSEGAVAETPRSDGSDTLPHEFVVLHRVLQSVGRGDLDATGALSQFYDESYFENYSSAESVSYSRAESTWTSFFSRVADRIVDDLAPSSVLDVGCALGLLVEALRDRGVDAWGIDVSAWAISQVPDELKPYCAVRSISEPLTDRYELITAIEVLEHLPAWAIDSAIRNLTQHTDCILLSSTASELDDITHLNVRTPDFWGAQFARHGFFRDFEYDASYISGDAWLVRRKHEPHVQDVVAGYEAFNWINRNRLQSILDVVVPERDELRQSVSELQRRVTEVDENRQNFEHRLGSALDALKEQEEFYTNREGRRRAEVAAAHDEILRREHLLSEASARRAEAERLLSEARNYIAAMEATKVFRYSARLRRFYGGLRGRTTGARSAQFEPQVNAIPPFTTYGDWVKRYDTLSEEDRASIRSAISRMTVQPLISVVMPVYNTPEQFLREAIESIMGQLYPRWELCIADDCSTEPHVGTIVREYAVRDDRIRFVRRQENGHICAASNSCLEVASGEWVTFLDHDDLLAEHALAAVVSAINENPDCGLLYSDEDVVDAEGVPLHHYFKPDFDPLLLTGMNHLCHVITVRRDLVDEVGGFRLGTEGSQDWDLILRVTETMEQSRVIHIPKVLYHWRRHEASTAVSLEAKPYAGNAGYEAVRQHIERTDSAASVKPLVGLGWCRVEWAIPDPAPTVTIVIPTRDGRWLERCLTTIYRLTTYPRFHVLVVDNGSSSNTTLGALAGETRLTVLRDEGPFNFSAINNRGVRHSQSDLVCLLNDDCEVMTPDWLDQMVGQIIQDRVGAVGAKLYYENGTVQHAGVILGIGGVGGHVHRGIDRLDIGYWGRAALPQHVSAVTAACMLVRREAWDEVGGLNEERLGIGYNDVDFCLKLGRAGWKVVWTPFAELVHHESATRGPDTEGENLARLNIEGRYMKAEWGPQLLNDPAYNPNLTLAREDFGLAEPPRLGLLDLFKGD